MKKLIILFTVILLITATCAAKETRREIRKAREKARMEEIQQLFGNRDLRFLAQSAHPMGGGVIHLTSEYTLDIQDQEVNSFLPFFGVAYTAEYGLGEGGIKFREKTLSANWLVSKKGYDVQMQIKTPRDLYTLYLFFSPTGFATLDVTCQNRQPIHFTGIVQAIPAEDGPRK